MIEQSARTSRTAVTLNPWLVSWPASETSALRLFCVGHAGSGASVFRTWAPLVPDEVELVAIRLPGREGRLRERPLEDCGDALDALEAALEGHLERPYCLFGHCSGALIAYQLAVRLSDADRAPAGLVVASQITPRLTRPSKPSISDLPSEQFWQVVGGKGGTDPAVLQRRDLLDLFEPALRADYRIADSFRYRAGKPLGIPVSVVAARDGDVPPDMLAEWRRETISAFDLHLLPCRDFFGIESWLALGRQVTRCIAGLYRPDDDGSRP